MINSTDHSRIEGILQSDDCTVENLLNDPELPQALRTSLAALQTFIQDDLNFQDLLDWVFADDISKRNLESFNKLTYNALSIFLAQSPAIQEIVYNHQYFIPRLKAFIDPSQSENINDPVSCGHFQYIIEHYSRFSHGILLQELSELAPFLIHNMALLSFRELFINLNSEFGRFFELTEQNAIDLSKETNEPTGYFVATAIKMILEKNPAKFIPLFQKAEVFTILLNSAKDSQPLVSNEIYRLLIVLYSNCTNRAELQPIYDEYATKFGALTTVNCSTATALRFFKVLNDDIFNTLFQKPVNTFLNESIIEVLTSMSMPQRDIHFKSVQAPQQLMNARYTTRANGHLFKLFDLFKETYQGSTNLQYQYPENWDRLSEDIEKTEALEQQTYGKHHKRRETCDEEDIYDEDSYDILDESSSENLTDTEKVIRDKERTTEKIREPFGPDPGIIPIGKCQPKTKEEEDKILKERDEKRKQQKEMNGELEEEEQNEKNEEHQNRNNEEEEQNERNEEHQNRNNEEEEQNEKNEEHQNRNNEEEEQNDF